MQELPRKIIFRDPRDNQHIAEAHRIIASLMPLTITQKSAREVRHVLGDTTATRLLSGIAVTATIPPTESIIIGSFFFIDRGMCFADNILLGCADCNAILQIRPEGLAAESKLCIFCAADRILAEHHDKSPTGRKTTRLRNNDANASAKYRRKPKKTQI